jgi:hypothetical protein
MKSIAGCDLADLKSHLVRIPGEGSEEAFSTLGKVYSFDPLRRSLRLYDSSVALVRNPASKNAPTNDSLPRLTSMLFPSVMRVRIGTMHVFGK